MEEQRLEEQRLEQQCLKEQRWEEQQSVEAQRLQEPERSARIAASSTTASSAAQDNGTMRTGAEPEDVQISEETERQAPEENVREVRKEVKAGTGRTAPEEHVREARTEARTEAEVKRNTIDNNISQARELQERASKAYAEAVKANRSEGEKEADRIEELRVKNEQEEKLEALEKAARMAEADVKRMKEDIKEEKVETMPAMDEDILEACKRTGLRLTAKKQEIWDKAMEWKIPEVVLRGTKTLKKMTRSTLMSRFARWMRGLKSTREEEIQEQMRVRTEEESREKHELIQALLDRTYTGKTSKDRKGPVPGRLEVSQVWRIKNAGQECSYRINLTEASNRRSKNGKEENKEEVATMVAPKHARPVTAWMVEDSGYEMLHELEVILYRGTSYRNLEGISKEYLKAGGNTDQEVRGRQHVKGDSWMFGKAVYLAEDSTKADEYANEGDEEDEHFMVICRASWEGQEEEPNQEIIERTCKEEITIVG